MADHRTLGRKVVPRSYKILFEPDMSKFKTSGKETIDLEVNEPTNFVMLNAAEMQINGAWIEVNGKNYSATKIELKESDGTLGLSFPKEFSRFRPVF